MTADSVTRCSVSQKQQARKAGCYAPGADQNSLPWPPLRANLAAWPVKEALETAIGDLSPTNPNIGLRRS
jgi:hypothetical protein